MWIRAFSVSFSLLACSSSVGERGLLAAAPFSGSAPRLTSVGMELPTGGAACLDATCSTVEKERQLSEVNSDHTDDVMDVGPLLIVLPWQPLSLSVDYATAPHPELQENHEEVHQ